MLQLILPIMHWTCCDISLCRALSVDSFVSVLVWSVYFASCSAAKCKSYDYRLFNALEIIALVAIGLAYVIMLIESCFSNERQYVTSMVQSECAHEFIDQLRAQPPTLVLTICCWHYETRTRVVYYTDANGNQQSRIETYQERVDTYTESEHFQYQSWRDTSAAGITHMQPRGVTRVKLSHDVGFGDSETATKFNDQKTSLTERNQHRDVYIDFGLDINIHGFKERLMGYENQRHVPWWLNANCFWTASLLGLTWPYRVYMKCSTGKTQFVIQKEVFVSEQGWSGSTLHNTVNGGVANGGLATEPGDEPRVQMTDLGAAYHGPPPSYESAMSQT